MDKVKANRLKKYAYSELDVLSSNEFVGDFTRREASRDLKRHFEEIVQSYEEEINRLEEENKQKDEMIDSILKSLEQNDEMEF